MIRKTGGMTIYGVSKRWHPKDFDLIYKLFIDGKRELAKDTAKRFYQREFYNPLYDELSKILSL